MSAYQIERIYLMRICLNMSYIDCLNGDPVTLRRQIAPKISGIILDSG
jgi:hypothetical protein